jgi:DNA-binding response OmpR family regulator
MPKKVLIVGDEANTVLSLEFVMQEAGYQVDVARGDEEALTKVDLLGPDLVLLDVMLPGANGLDILQHVRRNPAWHAMAIIMLTPKGRDVEAKKGMALGANAYVIKPFSTSDLLAEVHRCLDGGSPSASHV